MQVSQNQLSELTGKDRKTIRHLLADLKPIPGPHRAKLYESQVALETLYLGNGNGNGFVTHSEALRKLAIAREAVERERETKLKIENDLTRKRIIPAELFASFLENVFLAVRSKILGSHLSDTEKDQILNDLASLRDADL